MTIKNVFQVPLRGDGQITLPKELRDCASIKVGTMLTLHDLWVGVFLLSTVPSRESDQPATLAQDWREAGISLEDMLAE